MKPTKFFITASMAASVTALAVLGLVNGARAESAGPISPALPALPNDPFFPQQWSLRNDGTQSIRLDWGDHLHFTTQQGVSGTDIGWLQPATELQARASALSPATVAVIDSGMDPGHPDLQGRFTPDGRDFLLRMPFVSDRMGHGTHVSGIIAANVNSGTGIAGIAPASVKVLPLRILADSCGAVSVPGSACFQNFAYNHELISDYAAEAIRYAVAHHASVINMSLGWPKIVNTPNVQSAVQEAVQAGVLLVASAGNDRKDRPTYPCSYEGVLCVGAVTNTGAMAIYSNLGGIVDLLAPGDSIVSTYPTGIESNYLRIKGYERLSGTSQAAPHVAAIAAAVKSVFPDISLDELKARLLLSAAPLPAPGTSLYGLVNLQRAVNAVPQPVFLPDFKPLDEIPVDESTLRASGSIALRNLWKTATGVHAQILINGNPAGSAAADSFAGGTTLTIPWNFTFTSLDDSSALRITMRVSYQAPDATTITKDFSVVVPAVRRALDLPDQRVLSSVQGTGLGTGLGTGWIGGNNGRLYSRLTETDSYPAEVGVPSYFVTQGDGQLTTGVQIFDPANPNPVANADIPPFVRLDRVIRISMPLSGQKNWVVTGLGKDQKSGRPYFQFYFMDPDFHPLWGAASAATWRIDLTSENASLVSRNYAAPGSWVRSGDKLIPAFVAQGLLPAPDNFRATDPKAYQATQHFYYLAPGQPSQGFVPLTLRALDNADFQHKVGDSHLLGLAHPTSGDSRDGHLRAFFAFGDDLSAPIRLWDIRSISAPSFSPAPDWNMIKLSGLIIPAISPDFSGRSDAYLSFFDFSHGSLAWADGNGASLGRTEFAVSGPMNGLNRVIGVFDLPAGRVWFAETPFDLIAFHQESAGALQAPPGQTLPIERDSSFPGTQFSEFFQPVLVGNSRNPTAAVYVDSTLVRGDQVSVVTWNAQSGLLEKPLRYSLEIPGSCIAMNPAQLPGNAKLYALPLLCLNNNRIEYRLLQP